MHHSGSRQFALAIQAYAGDWEGFYPAADAPNGSKWPDTVHSYLNAHGGQYVDNGGTVTSGNIYFCPQYVATKRSTDAMFGYNTGYVYNISHQVELPAGTNRNCCYGWGGIPAFKFYHEAEVTRKTERIMIGDWGGRWLALWSPGDADQWGGAPHRKHGNFQFFDGHAGSLTGPEVLLGYKLP